MVKQSSADISDISHVPNGVMLDNNQTITADGNIISTYDDAIDRHVAEQGIHPYTHISNADDAGLHNNRYGYFKKHFLMCVFLTLVLLAGVVMLTITYLLNEASYHENASSKKSTKLNPGLCGTIESYHDRSWFIPSQTDHFICNAPIQISEIYIQDVSIINGHTYVKCLSVLECMTLVGLYLTGNAKTSKYSFFVDYESNVYGGRGWFCPFVSGQLWIGIIPNSYEPNRESEEIKAILEHFNTEIVSYALKCDFLSASGVNYKYLNYTHL